MPGDVEKSFFVHPQGLCESTSVGSGTKIWAFAHVLEGAVVGRGCNICDSVFIESDVIIGDHATIKNGVQLWDGVRLGSHVFVGPNATFTNDVFPRSKRHLEAFPKTIVRDGASIGANATSMTGVEIGECAMIGAGSVILADVPAKAIVVGNPGRVVGYAGAEIVDQMQLPVTFPVKTIKAGIKADHRGRLIVHEFADLPFTPQRMFSIDLVRPNAARGGHAHRECSQILTINAGATTCALDDGTHSYEVRLTDPGSGLFVPPGVWVLLFEQTQGAVLTILASHPYSASDYISDYSVFSGNMER